MVRLLTLRRPSAPIVCSRQYSLLVQGTLPPLRKLDFSDWNSLLCTNPRILLSTFRSSYTVTLLVL